MNTNFSPPASINVSLASILISSNVSRLSATNEGQTTAIFLIPFLGRFSSTLSVNGCNQPGPIIY